LFSRAFVVTAADAGPAISELMIDGRPAAAAPIKKSRRAGMAAFLRLCEFCSENPHDLEEDRPFQFCWQGKSAVLPSIVMSSRRLIDAIIRSPRRRGRAATAGFQAPMTSRS